MNLLYTRLKARCGHCYALFLMKITSGCLQGNYRGDQPSLTRLIDGDLSVTTDFRDIYATILEKVLKTPAEKVLGVWKGRTNAIKG